MQLIKTEGTNQSRYSHKHPLNPKSANKTKFNVQIICPLPNSTASRLALKMRTLNEIWWTFHIISNTQTSPNLRLLSCTKRFQPQLNLICRLLPYIPNLYRTDQNLSSDTYRFMSPLLLKLGMYFMKNLAGALYNMSRSWNISSEQYGNWFVKADLERFSTWNSTSAWISGPLSTINSIIIQ